VIQWHVFGMFAPSFFTGALVALRCAAPMLALLPRHVAVAVRRGHLHFLSALVLLGVG
jgi:hypothetical protein